MGSIPKLSDSGILIIRGLWSVNTDQTDIRVYKCKPYPVQSCMLLPTLGPHPVSNQSGSVATFEISKTYSLVKTRENHSSLKKKELAQSEL